MADKGEKSRAVDQFKYNEGDPEVVYAGPKPKSVGELTIKVKADIDVSEALTGLKALQRETREATRLLRELEEAQKGDFKHRLNVPIHAKNGGVEGASIKSITDDITRSYGLERGDGE